MILTGITRVANIEFKIAVIGAAITKIEAATVTEICFMAAYQVVVYPKRIKPLNISQPNLAIDNSKTPDICPVIPKNARRNIEPKNILPQPTKEGETSRNVYLEITFSIAQRIVAESAKNSPKPNLKLEGGANRYTPAIKIPNDKN